MYFNGRHLFALFLLPLIPPILTIFTLLLPPRFAQPIGIDEIKKTVPRDVAFSCCDIMLFLVALMRPALFLQH